MPIRDDKLKRHQYVASGKLLDADDVAKSIASIEARCSIVADRTAKCPELANWLVAYPLAKLPVPEQVNVTALQALTGVLQNLRFLDSFPAAPVVAASAFGNFDFSVQFAHRTTKRTLFAINRVEVGHLLLIISADCERITGSERAEWMSELVRIFAAPVNLRSAGKGYIFEHANDGGFLESARFEKDRLSPSSIRCDLPNVSPEEAFKRFSNAVVHPTLNAFGFKWGLGANLASESRVEAIIAALQRVPIPTSSQIEGCFWWTLRSYRDFPVMTAMAEMGQDDVAQSLFEFEFSGGAKGQLDVAADAQGRFKLVCSFDRPGDHAKFTKLTKIKLKEWH